MSGDEADKTLSCKLNDPESWLSSEVELTVEMDGESATCTTSASTFTCTEPSGNGGWSVAAGKTGVEVVITYTGTTSATFRCGVTVDNDVSDSKNVYAEALSKFPTL